MKFFAVLFSVLVTILIIFPLWVAFIALCVKVAQAWGWL